MCITDLQSYTYIIQPSYSISFLLQFHFIPLFIPLYSTIYSIQFLFVQNDGFFIKMHEGYQ